MRVTLDTLQIPSKPVQRLVNLGCASSSKAVFQQAAVLTAERALKASRRAWHPWCCAGACGPALAARRTHSSSAEASRGGSFPGSLQNKAECSDTNLLVLLRAAPAAMQTTSCTGRLWMRNGFQPHSGTWSLLLSKPQHQITVAWNQSSYFTKALTSLVLTA